MTTILTHPPIESSYVLYGRVYQTKVFKSVEETNIFLLNNPEYGLLAEDGDDCHVAKISDEGEKIN